MSFDAWLTYYRRNPERQARLEAAIDWSEPTPLTGPERAAIARSLQRFELGESGDGAVLLAKAERAGDPTYLAALELFVAEEQRHSALFGQALAHLGWPPLTSHWSDAAFTALRRALGLRTEVALFLVAEAVALHYFTALRDGCRDPQVARMAVRILADEEEHVRFQVHRLHDGLADLPAPARWGVRALWWPVALGAAVVVTVDHRAALRACGVRPATFLGRALRSFAEASHLALTPGPSPVDGPASTEHVRP
ncbi:ferritin-like domain-containing protein [Cellulomonas sp. zg-ZUI222]|uniref:Ferritin-like domain-containing protein n=1 Tax=Cellulomonas wangleii TaxID=2816956 RepID=A0ABX8D5D5_9CELL|nr:ferritin-like domain-containing protein [Cellulomonas wangleii]MBO0922127.1 ferritin-like domain-containing protein [Cellulomonas wangleii]MBO0926154.1 ferritin-like domain-containing protein [Cellulomonas wangleii]QVI62668.1 ferritin-like domain-containing protein [Cellulomonas wangleii]